MAKVQAFCPGGNAILRQCCEHGTMLAHRVYPMALGPEGPYPAPDPRAAELALIRSVADDVITRVMKEGEATHAVGEWRTRDAGDLLSHATAHVIKYIKSPVMRADKEELEHALTDIALVLAKQKEDGK